MELEGEVGGDGAGEAAAGAVGVFRELVGGFDDCKVGAVVEDVDCELFLGVVGRLCSALSSWACGLP